jgi:hypothetical protein
MLLTQPTVGSAKFATMLDTPSAASAVDTSLKTRISPVAASTASCCAASFPLRSAAGRPAPGSPNPRAMSSVASVDQSDATMISNRSGGIVLIECVLDLRAQAALLVVGGDDDRHARRDAGLVNGAVPCPGECDHEQRDG